MHAGSVALVLNPKTGHVSPQYHVVFDDNFTTVHHMRDGTLPPSWQDMCQRSIESANNEAFDLADIWFKGLTESEGTIKDPFAIISDQSGGKSGPSSDSADKRPTLNKDCEGEKKVAAQPDTKWVTFGDASSNQVSVVSEGVNLLRLPSTVNLYESVLRRSPRFQ